MYGRRHYQKNKENRIKNSINYYHSHKQQRAEYSHNYYLRKKQQNPDFFKGSRPRVHSLEQTVRGCYLTLNKYVFDAMERARQKCGKRVEKYILQYPFEQYAERAIRIRLARFGIYRGRGAYDDCYDAGMLAYMYSMHRCAVLECDYVVPYLLKMIRIYILCALIIYRDSHILCRINNLKELSVDKPDAQKFI